jgi:hypothetical protein
MVDTDGLTPLAEAFEAVGTAVSNLPISVVADTTFNIAHFEAPITPAFNDNTLEYAGTSHRYVANVDNITYNAYGQDGATDRAVLGSSTVSPYLGPQAVLSFPWDPDGEYPMIEVTANAELVDVSDSELGSQRAVMMCLQARQGGVWKTVRQTERFMSVRDRVVDTRFGPMDVGFVARLHKAMLPDTSGLAVTGWRVMISLVNGEAASSMTWQNWSFSAVPLRVEVGAA